MFPQVISEEQVEQAVELHKQGKSWRQIGEILGVHPGSIYKRAAKRAKAGESVVGGQREKEKPEVIEKEVEQKAVVVVKEPVKREVVKKVVHSGRDTKASTAESAASREEGGEKTKTPFFKNAKMLWTLLTIGGVGLVGWYLYRKFAKRKKPEALSPGRVETRGESDYVKQLEDKYRVI